MSPVSQCLKVENIAADAVRLMENFMRQISWQDGELEKMLKLILKAQ